MKNCPNCQEKYGEEALFCSVCGTKLASRNNVEEEKLASSEEYSEQTAEPADSELEFPLPEMDITKDSGSVKSEVITEPIAKHGGLIRGKKKVIVGALIFIALVSIIGSVFFIRHKIEEKRLIEQITALLGSANDCDTWTEDVSERFQNYPMTEAEELDYKNLLNEAEQLNQKDLKNQINYLTDMTAFEKDVKNRLNAEAVQLLANLTEKDPGYASDEQKETLNEYAQQMKELIDNGAYKKISDISEEWQSFSETAAQKKTGYQVNIMQYDFTSYPKVRIYLEVQDQATNQIVKELSPNMFYVSEKDAASGNFVNRTVKKAVQMNENERLNINLLADTSGSMMGESMDSAKSIMKNFLNTVQFSAGDQVKLTPFNSMIDKLGYFTGDLGALSTEVDGYFADGETKLYDSIIYGVQDVSGQQGAKCVLAFTDGMDVGSYNSAQNVINIVSSYKIPVFIVRIGDSTNAAEDSTLIQICQASGGNFKNLSQFGSDMTSFYNQIYRQMKQYYVIEYDALGTQNIAETTDISLYVQNQDRGGEAVAQINPGEELFSSLLGSYLRSYIYDMNNHNYNQLSAYVDDTVDPNDKYSIQWQMKKQVTGGFSNVTEETLMNYRVTDITVQDENTILLKADENYDVVYDEVIGDLKQSDRTVAQDALQFLTDNYSYEDISDEAEIRIWARVNQIPEYILKRNANGEWKFSQYAGSLGLGQRRQVYDVEVMYDPIY